MQVIAARLGQVDIVDMRDPIQDDNTVLVETVYSAVSPGTELELIQNSEIMVAHPLGYSAVARVVQVGSNVTHVEVGDMVACYGGPYVCHAPVLAVPKTLCVRVPQEARLDEAACVGLGAISIHGIRRAGLQFGESVLVMGLGILGQITSQICLQAGYRTIASDRLADRVELAKEHGAKHAVCVDKGNEPLIDKVREVSSGHGVDAVIICAHSLQPGILDEALTYVTERGKIVVVGNISMSCSREGLFQKEADLVIAKAGGPGRYDRTYEAEGRDYPYSFVRWTEGRNMEEYLRLIAEGRIRVQDMITHTFAASDAVSAYEMLRKHPSVMSILFSYSHHKQEAAM